MINQRTEPIVVGIDGSGSAVAALIWAAEEARIRNTPLHLIHAWELPTVSGMPPIDLPATSLQERAEQVLTDAIEAVPACAELVVTREVTGTGPARALIEASQGAVLVVVGSRGLGGFKGLLLGSVAQQVAHHSECPVVIVRSDA
jgi:nucleotide-binding universal stress UspA family protein